MAAVLFCFVWESYLFLQDEQRCFYCEEYFAVEVTLSCILSFRIQIK